MQSAFGVVEMLTEHDPLLAPDMAEITSEIAWEIVKRLRYVSRRGARLSLQRARGTGKREGLARKCGGHQRKSKSSS